MINKKFKQQITQTHGKGFIKTIITSNIFKSFRF
jgi:hypothetical protein